MNTIQRKIIKSTIWVLPFFIYILVLGVSPGYSGLASQAGLALQTGLASQSISSVWSPSMNSDISRLGKMLKEQQSERNRLLKESDRLAEKILREKQKSEGGGNRKLDSLMRESQRLVSDMESLSKQIEGTELHLRQRYSLAITALVKRIEEQSNDKKRSNDKERKTLLKQLLTYLKESEMLEKPIGFEVPKVSLELRDNDTSLEIRKKADFLSDQAALLKARIFQVEAQVAKLEKDKALRNKVRKFADDMSFFDDTVLVKERKIAHGDSAIKDSGPSGDSGNQDENPLSAPPSMLGGDIGDMPIPSGKSEETSISFILGKEAFDSSPSDLVFSQKSIDKQIELLEVQKSQIANQVQQLLQKTQNFYKRAEELGSLERP